MALRRAETEKGRPPYLVEIKQAWCSEMPIVSGFQFMVAMLDLYRNDELIADIDRR